MTREAIRWPSEFEPARAPIHAVNRLDIPAPPSAVWERLIRATEWPRFYANAADVVIDGGAKDLSPGARFTWKTFGVSLVSNVVEFVPGERVAWNAKSMGIWAYHAWLITPTATGCHVLTEETQYGLVARLGKLLFPKRMGDWHQRWLEGLAKESAPR